MSEFMTEAEKAEIERLTAVIKEAQKARRKIHVRNYQRTWRERHA